MVENHILNILSWVLILTKDQIMSFWIELIRSFFQPIKWIADNPCTHFQGYFSYLTIIRHFSTFTDNFWHYILPNNSRIFLSPEIRCVLAPWLKLDNTDSSLSLLKISTTISISRFNWSGKTDDFPPCIPNQPYYSARSCDMLTIFKEKKKLFTFIVCTFRITPTYITQHITV